MREKVILAREDVNARLEILKSFEPLIKKCIKYYVHDREYYSDAMQEGYYIILKCIYNYDFDKEYPFEGYVKSSLIFGIRNFAKKIKYNVSLDEQMSDEGGCLYDFLESDINVEEEYGHKDDIRRLKDAMDKLSDKQRKVIEEVYFKNKSMVEICKSRRCHYMAVTKMKDRALKKLREEMG
ncbi:RNA polymerase sporulation-specific sigma factor [Caloramator quimbayensis]|uniref:RNA polymerase sporulation-specific sigma factor n=1 Tax=Caloramator quimbayensis TaxID=1147123 RepID=A0A1T4XWF6_9CLOT|nr:sigma-70 family RNA polymerase sigma factor [Caloramator quimbayensis]SKA93892.1 RNA polymerase sporulation-specific sigma factor [Caloramator quimbayensis]